MKYIYYIIGILILITIGLAVRLSDLKVDVSESALIINDKIISKSELEDLSKFGSYHSRGKDFIDSVITRELLIQEAIKRGIHKEEAFRKSIEVYYEQSLVKNIVDRKIQALSPNVTESMIGKYNEMHLSRLKYTKKTFESKDDLYKRKVSSTAAMEGEFEDLSEALRYSLFLLSPGDKSEPELLYEGYVVYQLDEIIVNPEAEKIDDDSQVRSFLIDQEKNALFNTWMNDLKKNADIQVLSQENE